MSLSLDRSVWKRVRFGDVVRQVKRTVDPKTSGLERYVAGEHMETDELRISGWGVIGDGYLGPAFRMAFKAGQVLYGSRRTYLRKVAYADFDGICANTTFVAESLDPTVLLPELLPFVMTSEAFHAHSIAQSKGSVNPYVNWSDLAWFEFGLPPVDDQMRIARLLWSTEAQRQADIAQLDVLTQVHACYLDSVARRSSQAAPLGSLVSLQQGKPVPSGLYGDSGMLLLRPGDMQTDGAVRWTSNSVRIPSAYAEGASAYILSEGDLVINMTAQTLDDAFLGRVCRVPTTCLLNQRIGRLHLRSSDVRPDYLFHVLRSRHFTDYVARRSEGSKIKHMHWRHIQDFPVPLLDDEEQAKVVATGDGLRLSAKKLAASVAIDGDLRRALLAHLLGDTP